MANNLFHAKKHDLHLEFKEMFIILLHLVLIFISTLSVPARQ